MPEIKWIPVQELVIDPMNVRADNPIVDPKIIADIRKRGVINPLHVRKLPDGKYGVICGSRRLLALLKNSVKEAPCIVHEDMDDIEAYSMSLAENYAVQRPENWEFVEWIGKFYDMLREQGHTHKQAVEIISQKNNISKTIVEDAVKVANGHPVLKILLKPCEKRTEQEKRTLDNFLKGSTVSPARKSASLYFVARLNQLAQMLGIQRTLEIAFLMMNHRLVSKIDDAIRIVEKNPTITSEALITALRGYKMTITKVTVRFKQDEWVALGDAVLATQKKVATLIHDIVVEWLRRNKYLI